MLNSRPFLPLSGWITLAIILVLVSIRFTVPPINVLSWDVFGYYMYLPAAFIYHDLGLKDLSVYEQIIVTYDNTSTFYQVVGLPDGSHIFRYSMGMALVYLPFFFIGHVWALAGGYVTDGFSLPYQYAITGGAMLYTILGLIFLRKILRRFFNEVITSLTILVLVVGTNYFLVSSLDGLMTHNFLFTFYAVLIWLTIKYHEKPGIFYALFIGACLGWMALIRPTEIIAILIPLLWGITGKEGLLEKGRLIMARWKDVVVLLLMLVLAGLPQFIYWKVMTGQFLFNSYANPGEGLDLFRPYTLPFLFSYRKGWLVYTPVMIWAIMGIWMLRKRKAGLFLPILIFFLVNLWLVSSWTCWWYAGSYGQRSMIQSYAVMALPLGMAFHWIAEQRRWLRSTLIVLVSAMVLLNLFQTWQYRKGIIPIDRITRAYYWKVFGKTSVDEADKELLMVARPGTTYETLPEDLSNFDYRVLGHFDFDTPETGKEAYYVTEPVFKGQYSLKMDSTMIFSPGLHIPYREISNKSYVWFRASVWVYPVHDIYENPVCMVVTFNHKGGNYKYRTASVERKEYNVVPGQWNKLELAYISPEYRSTKDNFSVYMWLMGRKEVYVDELLIEVWEPREE